MASGTPSRKPFLWYEFCYIAKGWSQLTDGRYLLDIIAYLLRLEHPLYLQRHVILHILAAIHNPAIPILQWLNNNHHEIIPQRSHVNLLRQITQFTKITNKITTLYHIDNVTCTSRLGIVDVLYEGNDWFYC